jgi:hypothetical protein
MNYKNLKPNQPVHYRGSLATVVLVESAATVVIRIDIGDGNTRIVSTSPSKLKPHKSKRTL